MGLARSKPSFSGGVSGGSLLVQQVCNYAKKAMGLPRCFFDLTADNAPLGRVVIEVSGIFLMLRVKMVSGEKKKFNRIPVTTGWRWFDSSPLMKWGVLE